MPKIIFNGVEYDNAGEMPPDVRAQYDKAVRNLPDRDHNGIPDLLESSDASKPIFAPAITTASAVNLPISKIEKVTRWVPLVVGAAFVGIIACVALAILGVMSLMKSSGAYQLALDTARAHPTAQEILGTPIQDGLFISGSESDNGSTGTAELQIPVSGPSQSGTLYVQANKENDSWKLKKLMLQVGDRQVSLLP